jgi:hypothetical protein
MALLSTLYAIVLTTVLAAFASRSTQSDQSRGVARSLVGLVVTGGMRSASAR